MKYIYIAIVLSVTPMSAVIPLKAATLDLPKYGFAMDVLDAPLPSGAPTQAIMSFLPAQDGFSPNVNVVIQPYPGTIKDYITLSEGQFKQMNWSVISEKTISDNEWICEYSGTMQQVSLHWYARAIMKSGKVYLVTATAADSSWKAVADTLKKSVESFRLK
jgi:hypothetical protein